MKMMRLNSILKLSKDVKIFAMIAKEIDEEFKEVNDAQMLWSWKIQKNDHFKNSAIIKIFKEYKKYQILFKKKNDQETLLKHQS